MILKFLISQQPDVKWREPDFHPHDKNHQHPHPPREEPKKEEHRPTNDKNHHEKKPLTSVFTLELEKMEDDYLKHEERREKKEHQENFVQPTLNLDKAEEFAVIGRAIQRRGTAETIGTLCLENIEANVLKEPEPQKLLITETLDLDQIEKRIIGREGSIQNMATLNLDQIEERLL